MNRRKKQKLYPLYCTWQGKSVYSGPGANGGRSIYIGNAKVAHFAKAGGMWRSPDGGLSDRIGQGVIGWLERGMRRL